MSENRKVKKVKARDIHVLRQQVDLPQLSKPL